MGYLGGGTTTPTVVNEPDLFFLASVRTWVGLTQRKLVFTVNTAPLPERHLGAPVGRSVLLPYTVSVMNERCFLLRNTRF